MLNYGLNPSAENLKHVRSAAGKYYCEDWNSTYMRKVTSINLIALVLWLCTVIAEKVLVSISNLRGPLSEYSILVDNMRLVSAVKFV